MGVLFAAGGAAAGAGESVAASLAVLLGLEAAGVAAGKGRLAFEAGFLSRVDVRDVLPDACFKAAS